MPKIAVYPLRHDQYDDLVSALGLTRAQIAKLCRVSPHSVGWWRHTESIPLEHLEALKSALRGKLDRQKEPMNAVEQRALAYITGADLNGTAAPSIIMAHAPPLQSAGSKALQQNVLRDTPLADLIEEIRRRGGSVIFEGKKPKGRKGARS